MGVGAAGSEQAQNRLRTDSEIFKVGIVEKFSCNFFPVSRKLIGTLHRPFFGGLARLSAPFPLPPTIVTKIPPPSPNFNAIVQYGQYNGGRDASEDVDLADVFGDVFAGVADSARCFGKALTPNVKDLEFSNPPQ